MRGLLDRIGRIGAFARKEILDVIRQPRILLTLILGPFLILALFGVGYRQQIDPLRAVFVIQADSELAAAIENGEIEFDAGIDLLGTVETEAEALQRVRRGDADVVVVTPATPSETIRNGERARFRVLHDRLDPVERATVSLLSEATVDLVNRRVLERVVAAGQEESEALEALLPAARESARSMRAALESGDSASAAAARRELESSLERIEARTGPSRVLLDNIRRDLDTEAAGPGSSDRLADIATNIDTLAAGGGEANRQEQIDAAAAIEADLETLETEIETLQQVPPEILVSPFDVDTDVVGSVQLDVTAFYAPGVIALLVQHIGITLAGLSLVRERSLGTTELFRVSPLTPLQLLIGKYIGYTVAIALVASALSALMFGVFGVPLAGDVGSYVAVVALLALASLGLGFAISALVDSDTQAVNVSMIVLLLSIFFSGFFLSLDRIVGWVRGVSWMLPISHAIEALRDVMFRGEAIAPSTLAYLGGGAGAFFIASLLLIRWRLRSE